MPATLLFEGTAITTSVDSAGLFWKTPALRSNEYIASGLMVSWDVSNVSGTPTFDLDIEHSPDGTVWFVATSMTQAATATSEFKVVNTNIHQWVRASITVGGSTPQADIKVWIEENMPPSSAT